MLYTIVVILHAFTFLLAILVVGLICRNKIKNIKAQRDYEANLRKTTETNLNMALDYINKHNLLIPVVEMKLQDYTFEDIVTPNKWN